MSLALIGGYGSDDSEDELEQSMCREQHEQEPQQPQQPVLQQPIGHEIHQQQETPHVQTSETSVSAEEECMLDADATPLPPPPSAIEQQLQALGLPRRPPPQQCNETVRTRVSSYLQQSQQDHLNFTSNLKSKKQFGNPELMQSVVEHMNVFQYGSNFPTCVFDPRGIVREDFADVVIKQSLEAQQQQQQQLFVQQLQGQPQQPNT